MEQQPRAHTALHSSPFQARAAQFFKKFGLRRRAGHKKSKDNMTPVTMPVGGWHRTRSEDILRKPDVPPLIGFRIEDGPNPTDTDDSSQDASTSGNSPAQRSRRYSEWDQLVQAAPVSPTFAGRGPASLFFREEAVAGGGLPLDDSGNVLAPAPLFLRSNMSSDAVMRSPNSPTPSSRPETPTAVPQIIVSPDLGEQVDQTSDIDQTPRPSSGGFVFSDDNVTTKSTDLASSPPSPANPAPSSQSLSVTDKSPSESIQGRRSPAPQLTTPLPPPFRVATERGLRLSPSIITRQPMPLLNLPTLPPPTPVVPPASKPQVRLRSMPSLSVHGHSNTDRLADHDNATLGDSDEDDMDMDEDDEEDDMVDAMSAHQSDEEDDEPPSPPPAAGPSGTQGIVTNQKQPERDVGASPVGGSSTAVLSSTQGGSTPVGPNVADYFSSVTYSKPIQLTPGQTPSTLQPFSPKTPIAEAINLRNTQNVLPPIPPIPGPSLEHRPSLYRAASRSMINLNTTRRGERVLRRMKSRDSVHSNAPSVSGQTAESHAETVESDDTDEIIGRLLRRTSMPSFHPTSDPPPYPTFNPRPKDTHRVLPREDEGRERLPPYSNSLYLMAIMPRKMEFSSPGVEAKDRKWRRVVCELEGTAFRVYKCPPGASGAGVIGEWWEKRVGVGDVTSGHYAPVRKKEEQFEKPAKLGIDEPSSPVASSSGQWPVLPTPEQTRRRSESQSSMATQSTTMSTPRAAKRMSGASFLSPFRGSSSNRPQSRGLGSPSRPESRGMELLPVDVHDSRSSLSSDSHESHGRTTPMPSSSPQPRSASRLSFLPGRLQWRSGEVHKPAKSELLHSYTLQHAESGLGNDYLKRKNVIRVRLEGEQFLLQARDVPAVVEWIEGLHAGTNIALDLDHRVMPKGPMFPRRRRRRARRPQVGEASNQASNAQATATQRLA